MRLIFVTDTLVSGGAERVVSILANHFADKYETEVICLRKRKVFYSLSTAVNVVFMSDMADTFIGQLMWLRKYIKCSDVVIPFMVKVYCVVLIALLGKKCTIVASERNDPRMTSQPWRFLRKLLIFKVDALIVQTIAIKNYFKSETQKKIHVILNPLEGCQCSNTPWNKASRIILAIGRTDDQKNYPMMIRAFDKIRKRYPDFHLEIWGNRDENIKCCFDSLINKLGVGDYISIHGRTNDVAELYAKAYMFVMSSNYEGLSNAMIEALCSGLPVVSTKVSGATDVIANGENGILVEIGDEQGFYLAMKHLIEKPEVAEILASNALKCRGAFSVEKICNQWEMVINRCLSNSRK